MPEKDGSDDKKSTKSVVNKKQKQLMNKEQLDLTSVAESFGGQIVGEPVELDEFRTGNPALDAIYTSYQAADKVGKFIDKLVKPKLLPPPTIKPSDKVKINGNEYKRNKDGYIKLYTNDELIKKKKELETNKKEKELETKKKENKVIKYDMVAPYVEPKIKPIKPFIKPVEEPDTAPETEVETEPKIDLDQLKNNKKNKVLVKPTDTDTKTDKETKTTVLPLPLLNKTKTKTRTRTRTKVGGDIPKLPKMPGTVHNVGRRVNPQ